MTCIGRDPREQGRVEIISHQRVTEPKQETVLRSLLSKRSPVLVQELGVELHDALDPVCAGREESRAEVQGAFFLAEAGAWYHAHACCVEQAQTVEFICRAALGDGSVDGLGGKFDGGE